MSSALLPGGPALVALLLIISLVTILLWRYFIQVHAKAQIALLETFSQPPAPAEKPAAAVTLPSLVGAQLETVALEAGGAAAGKLIRELELRTKTGASIVGIERATDRIINPGPDEELKGGDRVLLLGAPDQIAAARRLLTEA